MPESHAARGTRRGRRALVTLGEELRAARLASGLSQRLVADASGISVAELSRVERATAPWLGVLCASRIAAVVGLDLSVRTYPGVAPLRDAAHLALFTSIRAVLGTGLNIRSEVPLSKDGDQRAWDAVIGDGRVAAGVELETRVTDLQALLRRVNLKVRDGGLDRALIVVADTRHNRHVVRLAGPELDAFPLSSRTVLAALANGSVPPSSGLAFIRAARPPK